MKIDSRRLDLIIAAEEDGLPPLVVVQGGPGLPLLHEMRRYRRAFRLERRFSVAYWEQPGTGPLPAAGSLGLERLVAELRAIIRELADRAETQVSLLGVSIGANVALRAASLEGALVASVVAISPDIDVSAGDGRAYRCLLESAEARGDARLLRRITRLGPPPYPEPARFGERLSLIAELGGIEMGKRYPRIAAETAARLCAAYGPRGAVAALRNLTAAQSALLPELSAFSLLEAWPDVAAPVLWVFGSRDPLTASESVDEVRKRMKPKDRLLMLEGAGHLAHFDRSAEFRKAVLG